jgi:hypothetical protein
MQRNTDAMRRMRARWKVLGLCLRCGCDKDGSPFTTCSLCRRKRSEYRKRRNTTLISAAA